MSRKNISSGSKWEPIVGYSRAVRVGVLVAVSGTTAATEDGTVVGVGDAYAQAKTIFSKIEKALNEAGAGMQDVFRTRMFVTDISKWEEIARAHRESFGSIRPAATMVEVESLIDPLMLVEIEADAYLDQP